MKNLGFSLVLVVITAVVGLGWLVTELNYWLGSDSFNEEIVAYQKMGKGISLSLDSIVDKQIFLDPWQKNNDFEITLQLRDAFPIPTELLDNFEQGEPLTLESDGNISLHFFLPDSNEVMSLVLPEEISFNERSKLSLILTLFFYSGIVAIILIWLYPLMKRLIVLGNTAHDFGKGNLFARVDASRISYISHIENEFNNMAERIQALIADNKILSRAVSHNLKTPLARLRFGIDTWQETEDEVLKEKYINRINKDLVEMEGLVETLLQYARLDEANIFLQEQAIDLNEFVSELFIDIDDPKIKVNFNYTDAHSIVIADEKYLAMLLNNLINNAFIHAKSRINISLMTSKNIISIIIEDDGKGIPINERAEVIKPFLQGKNSVNNSGHGMGLAIADRIAHWFGSELLIDDSAELGGVSITLKLAAHNLN